MARFNPSLHPRDKNGKFTSKGGGGKSRASKRPPRQRRLNKASTPASPQPLARRVRNSKNLEDATAGVMIGLVATQGAKQAGFSALAAGRFYATGRPLLAAAAGAKAVTSAAVAANEVHRIRTVTSDTFKTRTVEEQSKFTAAAARRDKILNRADSAVDLVSTVGTPLVLAAQLYAMGKNRPRPGGPTRYTDNNANDRGIGSGRPGIRINTVKANRAGVYDITTAGQRRFR